MSSVTTKAQLKLKLLHCLNRSKHILLESFLDSLPIGDHKGVIDDAGSLIQDNDQFDLIQRLDNHLHAHVNNEDYDSALESALEMQRQAPESYYGYHREAQIHLIRNEYHEAYQVYTRGYKKVVNGIQFLHKSAKDAQHLFDQAAVDLAKTDQYDEAIKIANWVISLLPTSPTGYIRVGELYETQGNIKAAMEVYKQGMSCVSVEHRKLLEEHITCLQQRIDQMPHYDFIVQMPLEITSKIAQYLTVSDLIECLKVSRTWKERIEQCAAAWRVLKVGHGDRDINVNALQHIKKFVRQVTMVTSSANKSIVKDLLTSMSKGEFENLTYLSFAQCTMGAECIPELTRVLDCVNLRRLDLTFSCNELGSYIPLHQVLRPCSHLKQLMYHTDSFATNIDQELLPKEPTMITHLSIGGYPYDEGKVETPHFFIPLLPLFPHLVDLCITDSSPGDLQTISDQCPNLRRLVVIQAENEAFLDFPDLKCTPKGLQYLRINGYIDPKDVAGVIAQNSKTLELIDVTLDYDTDLDGWVVNPNWDWKYIPQLNCPVLKKLHFSVNYYWPFEQWIGDCPALQDIKLDRATDLTNSIFKAFRRLPKLRSLDLEDCQELTDAGLSEFFNNLKEQNSQLHTVVIRYCDSLSTETLLSLVALPSLRNLCIQSCTGVTEPVFRDFAARVSTSNSIESVSLRWLRGVTVKPLLQLIHALPNLQRLNIYFLSNINDDIINTIANIRPGISISTQAL